MRIRVFSWEYHNDPERLTDEVNECIKSCENLGDTVLDADVVVTPNAQAKLGMEYLVIVKFESNRSVYLLPEPPEADEETGREALS